MATQSLSNEKRIDNVLNIIRLVWSKCPDSRLTQLIINALGMTDQPLSYIGDEVLIKKIAAYGLRFVDGETEERLLTMSGMLDDLVKGARIEEHRSWKNFLEKEINTTNP